MPAFPAQIVSPQNLSWQKPSMRTVLTASREMSCNRIRKLCNNFHTVDVNKPGTADGLRMVNPMVNYIQARYRDLKVEQGLYIVPLAGWLDKSNMWRASVTLALWRYLCYAASPASTCSLFEYISEPWQRWMRKKTSGMLGDVQLFHSRWNESHPF